MSEPNTQDAAINHEVKEKMKQEEATFWDNVADNEVDEWYAHMEQAAEAWADEQEAKGITPDDEERRALEELCELKN